ncbi:MAG TPA: hypothetical protein VMG13_25570 [Trebonia sp.]|nr:hypothetical protein [Trebonia sp.]
MAGQHDRPRTAAQLTDQRAHVGLPARIQPVGRLVQDQHPRILQDGRGHAQPLPHPVAIAGHPIPGPFGQPGLPEHHLHAPIADPAPPG